MEMGITERHWFEDKEPELTEHQLEDIVYENKKAYDNGYAKGFNDAITLILKQLEEINKDKQEGQNNTATSVEEKPDDAQMSDEDMAKYRTKLLNSITVVK